MSNPERTDILTLGLQAPSLSTVRPIFITGIMPRCGTNFLFDLLKMHPDCHAGLPGEDNVIRCAPTLLEFVDELVNSWPTDWEVRQIDCHGLLRRCLGYAILDFLASEADVDDAQRHAAAGLRIVELAKQRKRIVNKTPSVAHLDTCFKLFPESYLIILVRDGRSVVESGLRSGFGWDFEYMARAWNWSAQKILAFTQACSGLEKQHFVVRYEDLFERPELELRRLFHAVALNPDVYDFATAANLPVRGSSTYKTSANPDFFNAIPKSSEFNPKQRHEGWTRAQNERFNWIAGESLRHFGYEPTLSTGSRIIWWMKNIAQDIHCKLIRRDLQ